MIRIEEELLAELFVYFGLHGVFPKDEILENWILNGLKELYDDNVNNLKLDREFTDIHQNLASAYDYNAVKMQEEELERLYCLERD